MIPFHKNSLGQEEIDAVSRVLLSGKVAHGVESHLFEKEFADYVGVKYAIFTNSCTSALKLAFKYFKNKRYSSYKLLTPNTFCATYAAAEELGLRPMAEINDTEDEDYLTKHCVKIATHYAGIKYVEDVDIEDAAHRIEKNDPLIGKIRCYSFHGTKAITTGHGGMLVTNDKEVYEYALLCNNDGIKRKDNGDKATWDYTVELMSGGYDGSDINATIGREQLKKLPKWTQRRNEILDRYNKELGTDWKGNYFYVHFLKDLKQVNDFIKYMDECEIGTSYHYPGNNWLGVSLPIYPELTDKEHSYILEKVKLWNRLHSDQ